MMNPALERAIAFFGSLAEMSRQMGVTYQAIQQWQAKGRVPSDHCTKLSQLTGESREDLIGWPPLDDDVTDRAGASDDVQPPVGSVDPESDED